MTISRVLRRFFSFSVHDAPGAYGLVYGDLLESEMAIRYRAATEPQGDELFFRFDGSDAFSDTAFTRNSAGKLHEAWVARFERTR